MVSGFKLQEFSQAAFQPRLSDSIVAMVGPASKGEINRVKAFSDAGTFVESRGNPVLGHYGVHASLQYLEEGSQLKHVRIAGNGLKAAEAYQYKLIGGKYEKILKFTLKEKGTWGNNNVQVSIFLNGNPVTSYDVVIRVTETNVVENFTNVTNSNVETTINNNSNLVTVELFSGAGLIFPDTTFNSDFDVDQPIVFSGGDDGAFANTKNEESITGGVSEQLDFAYTVTTLGLTTLTKDENKNIIPGTFIADDGVEIFSDNEDGTLTGDQGGDGVIDYVNGIWTINYNAASINPTDISYTTGLNEQILSLTSGDFSYAEIIQNRGIKPDSFVAYDNRNYQLDIGDGATSAYPFTIGKFVAGTLRIVAIDVNNNEMVITDDGNGNLIGDVTGTPTVIYATGVGNANFSANVKNLAAISATFETVIRDDGLGALSGNNVAGTINYQSGEFTFLYSLTPVGDFVPNLLNGGSVNAVFTQVTVVDFGDGIIEEYSGILESFPVKPGSVVVTHGVGATLTDNGDGTLSGAGGSGTINYFTGEYTLVFNAAPAVGFTIFIEANSVILHVIAKYIGEIGQRRETLENGFYVWVDKSPNSPILEPEKTYFRVRLFFDSVNNVAAVETFDLLKSLDEVVSVVNGTNGSEYITLEKALDGHIDTTLNTNLGQKIGLGGAFTNADVVGVKVGNNVTGLKIFDEIRLEPFDILACPGLWHRQVHNELKRIAEKESALFLFSLPDTEDPIEAKDFTNGEYNSLVPGGVAKPNILVPYPPLSTVNTNQGICFFPQLKYYDQYSDSDIFQPVEGTLLKILSRTERDHGSHQTISGRRRGLVGNAIDVRINMSEAERQLTFGLVGSRIEVINPILKFVGEGIFLSEEGTMTRTPGDPLDRIHARWMQNKINRILRVIGPTFSFEINNASLWREVTSKINKILKPLVANQQLINASVVCDGSINTQEIILQRQVIAKIFIQHLETAENVIFQAIFTRTSVNLSQLGA